MPPTTPSSSYICLPCLIRTATRSSQRKHRSAIFDQSSAASTTEGQYTLTTSTTRPLRSSRRSISTTSNVRQNALPGITSPGTGSEEASYSIKLDAARLSKIGRLHSLRARLKNGLSSIPEAKNDPHGVPFEKVIQAVNRAEDWNSAPMLKTLEQVYAGKPSSEALQELSLLSKHRTIKARTVEDQQTIEILQKLGLGAGKRKQSAPNKPVQKESQTNGVTRTAKDEAAAKQQKRKDERRARAAVAKAERALTLKKKKAGKAISKVSKAPRASDAPPAIRLTPSRSKAPATASGRSPGVPKKGIDYARPRDAPDDASVFDPAWLPQRAIDVEEMPKVPKLSFDLSRVLFNPGVYHLQDPRSRVFNFDPYLQVIMPVSEFNFDALNPYITSSQDTFLRDVSMKHQKKYIGSSSSMSGAMSQFHFLLSAWRPIDPSTLSQRIEGLNTFTIITRAPASIFLRWRDGVYAIDADKEHDSPNILMMQGKSMEKLLTLEKDDFEKFRKPKGGEEAPAIDADPEAYHYSSVGDFLLRSQLDAYDSRLPGTGMFDLKTRAVAGIRMNMGEYETGMGYQIKDRFGLWESYDREYFDMIRSAFLKYSLQVRMGRMDGIFVAYHNIARIFGFQYISLAELDMALHGQADSTLGHREFRASLKLMNDVFDQATQQFPRQSLRFTFDMRDASQSEPNGYMRIFAEPMSEEQIDVIQKSGKEKVAEYEKNMAQGIDPTKQQSLGETLEEVLSEKPVSPSILESNEADSAFLDEVLKEQQPTEIEAETSTKQTQSDANAVDKHLAAWTLRIYNEVNGRQVARPSNITTTDTWVIKYSLQPMEERSRASYTVAQNKRQSALDFASDRKDNFFLRKIRELSEAGREWRKEQDALDAEQQKIVLYSPSAPPPTPDRDLARND